MEKWHGNGQLAELLSVDDVSVFKLLYGSSGLYGIQGRAVVLFIYVIDVLSVDIIVANTFKFFSTALLIKTNRPFRSMM